MKFVTETPNEIKSSMGAAVSDFYQGTEVVDKKSIKNSAENKSTFKTSETCTKKNLTLGPPPSSFRGA